MIKTTQKAIRQAINSGIAQPLNEAHSLIETGARTYGDFRRISYSIGIYGVNGLMIEDTTTGDLYADAARTTNVFYFC